MATFTETRKGTYSYAANVVTITVDNGLGVWAVSANVTLDFTASTGSALVDKTYTISTGGTGVFYVATAVAGSGTGTCKIYRTITTNAKIASDVQKLYAGKLVDLFELDATELFGATPQDKYYFHAGVNELGDDIRWQGIDYIRFPIQVEGLEVSGSNTGPPARPTIKVSNYDGLMGAAARSLQDLLGAKLIRRRTFVKYLDAINFDAGNASADKNAHFPDEIWFVDRKAAENAVFIEWELASALDITGVVIPNRQCIQNTCTWKYKSAECGWIPGAWYNKGDVQVFSAGLDSCGKRLSSCKVRFGASNPLPFGAFPGVGLF